MITDPNEAGYRYPQPGERYWHEPWQRWVIVDGDSPYGLIPDEVAAHYEDEPDEKLVVKLRSLVSPP